MSARLDTSFVARKTKYNADERGAELSEMLDTVEHLLERTKVLYEQYFLGIQRIPPAQLHRDIERKIRELTQAQVRNTALRFRLTTVTQKFGSYNTYWHRTMRAIEQGRYTRDIVKARRRALRRGEDVPDELLVSMPKAIRDRIKRDRDSLARRHEREQQGAESFDYDVDYDAEDFDLDAAMVRESKPEQPRVHQIDDDGGFDDQFDELFAALTQEAEAAVARIEQPKPSPPPAAKPAPAPAPRTAAAERPRPAPRRPDSVPPPGPAPQATRPAPQTARPRPASAPPPPGMTEDETRHLYERYRQARQNVGAKDVSYEKLKRTLNEQAPKIMEQYKARGVKYDVVVKNDKVVLKAIPDSGK